MSRQPDHTHPLPNPLHDWMKESECPNSSNDLAFIYLSVSQHSLVVTCGILVMSHTRLYTRDITRSLNPNTNTAKNVTVDMLFFVYNDYDAGRSCSL